MTRCLTILLLASAAHAAPFDPHPLTESQQVRLETADEGGETIIESALYALLENAATWSDTEAGAVVPDYAHIWRQPEAWRGERVLIEGQFIAIEKLDLGSGWNDVSKLVIKVTPNPNQPEKTEQVNVIVLEPPNIELKRKTHPAQSFREPYPRPYPIRIVGRFFKSSKYETRASQNTRAEYKDQLPADEIPTEYKTYLNFVARKPTWVRSPVDTETGAGQSAEGIGTVVFFAVLIAVALVYFFWRLNQMRRQGGGLDTPRLREYIREREERRRAHDPDDGDEEDEYDDGDLPADPAGALDALSKKHEDSVD